MSGGHNLEHEETYQEQPRIVKKREERNKARDQLEKAGKVHKGDGVDVDHRQPLQAGGSNARRIGESEAATPTVRKAT